MCQIERRKIAARSTKHNQPMLSPLSKAMTYAITQEHCPANHWVSGTATWHPEKRRIRKSPIVCMDPLARSCVMDPLARIQCFGPFHCGFHRLAAKCPSSTFVRICTAALLEILGVSDLRRVGLCSVWLFTSVFHMSQNLASLPPNTSLVRLHLPHWLVRTSIETLQSISDCS